MNVDEIQKNVSKSIKNVPLNQELSPGTTERRWIPPDGLRKHREKIHRESKIAEDQKDLPFTFRKPPKSSSRFAYVECDNCGRVIPASTITVGVICKECGSFSTVTEIVDVG